MTWTRSAAGLAVAALTATLAAPAFASTPAPTVTPRVQSRATPATVSCPGVTPTPLHVRDFTGDIGGLHLAVFRPSNGTWYINGLGAIQFGTNGDIPVAADYTGQGNAVPAVFRPSNGTWYIRGVGTIQFGQEIGRASC